MYVYITGRNVINEAAVSNPSINKGLVNSLKSNNGRLYIYILSVYSPFSVRFGLPLHNIHIPSPFTSVMDIFFVVVVVCHDQVRRQVSHDFRCRGS